MHADPVLLAREPVGLAFEIPDLLLAQAFAASCSLRLAVETSHHTEDEELEEVLALYHSEQETCQHLIWRTGAAVVVQPMPGRPQHFACLSDALEWLKPEEPVRAHNLILAKNASAAFRATRSGPHVRAGSKAGSRK